MILKSSRHGFTLTELLISVAILAILVVIALSMVRSNRDKADDATTKADLNRLKIAFEDYYGDNNCYPPPEFFDSQDDCNSANLSPYLGNMPCDATTGLPYVLETDPTGCNWFKLYTNLKASETDPQALALCGDGGSTLGNYGVSSENVAVTLLCPEQLDESIQPSSNPGSPNPTPLPPGQDYSYCSDIGNCTTLFPEEQICTPYYIGNNCDGGSNPCQSVASCIQL